MFVLDTNVVSETFAAQPSPAVIAWIESHSRENYWVTAITRAELVVGMLLLPEGRKKQALMGMIASYFKITLRNAVLPFGEDEADRFAEIVTRRRRIGNPIGDFDAQIAATAFERGFAVVTRNVRDFENCGVEVINPWQASA